MNKKKRWLLVLMVAFFSIVLVFRFLFVPNVPLSTGPFFLGNSNYYLVHKDGKVLIQNQKNKDDQLVFKVNYSPLEQMYISHSVHPKNSYDESSFFNDIDFNQPLKISLSDKFTVNLSITRKDMSTFTHSFENSIYLE